MVARSLWIVVVSTLACSRYVAAQTPQSGTADPSGSRLMLGPTARTLKQGQFSIDLSAIVGGPLAEIGLTDRISFGAGTPVLVPGIRAGSAWLVTPKVRVFSGQRTDASVGVLHASEANGRSSGLAYSVVTRGTRDAAVTAGLGFTYPLRNGAGPAAVGMLSGEKRVSPRFKVTAEGYMNRGGNGILSVGARAIGRHTTADVGLAAFVEGGHAFPAPIFRLAWTR
jgi:hypothetical protein